MNPDQVKDLLNQYFSEITPVDEQVYRVAKLHDQDTYQICYVDYSQKLLDPEFDINEYQRKILLEDYYSNEGAIQWNFYLYFLIDDKNLTSDFFQRVKYEIEENRKLTRKYVLTLSEFIESNKTIIPNESLEKPLDIIEHWRNNLSEPLHSLLNVKVAMSGIVDSFIAGDKTGKSTSTKKKVDVEKFPVIQQFKLNKYRLFPLKRSFEFGKINLIHGPNAVGKTSLLEAIELSVCGRTIRNPNDSEDFSFTIITDAEETRPIKKSNDLEYRSRDFHWYGRNYRQGNSLYKSFARFNFFDADAAVNFSERLDKEGGIDEALSLIVFGSEADEIFKRFATTEGLFASEKSNLDHFLHQHTIELTRSTTELNERSKADAEAYTQDFIKTRLKELGLVQVEFEQEPLENLLNELGEATVFIAGWESLNVKFEIFNFKDFDNTLNKLNELSNQLKKLDTEKEANAIQDSACKAELSKLELRIRNLELLRNYERSGAKNLNQLETTSSRLKEKIEVFDKVNRLYAQLDRTVLVEYEGNSISEAFNLSSDELNSLTYRESENNIRLQNIKKQLNQIDVLTKQIKALGKSIILEAPETEVCPLCNTDLKPSTLAQEIEHFSEKLSSSNELDLLVTNNSELTKLKVQFEHKTTSLRLLKEIQTLLDDESDNDIFIKEFLARLETSNSQFSIIKSEYELVEQKLKKFSEENFSTRELKSLYLQLNIQPEPRDQLDEIDSYIREGNSKISELAQLQETILSNSKRLEDGINQVKSLASTFDENLSVVKADNYIYQINDVKNSIIEFKSLISIDDLDTPQSLEFRLSESKGLIGAYLNSVGIQNSLNSLKDKIKDLNKKIADKKLKRDRANKALSELREILSNHKPSTLLDDFMKKYARMISSIFEQIHSPREFEEIVFKKRELFALKTSDQSLVPLTKLSTGQRTAFVLSVFLAMNTSVNDAPRLLIFDDPVAYVDDLNVLSFLDYLQKMVIEADRQIFFATANKRIASLFEKKFDFLRNNEKGFKSIQLSRLEYDSISGLAS